MEKLIIAGREFDSRLFLGTGKFNSEQENSTQTSRWKKPSWHPAQKWLL